ncbi:methyltransferase domain-containing protein [Candidatus Pelagibacter sp. HIMB1521]|uniref:methyltransferase domain-containing protein n=1 Tax=Candidatus Pelagibacter sp. HIMB1521 TaxID=3413344 RepID=UPI003F860B77
MNKKTDYEGWELDYFDKAKNFRNYQWSLFGNFVKKNILEVGPGNCVFLKEYYPISNKIHLYEPSGKIREKLKERTKKFKRVKILNKYNTLKYDTIIYLDVLEHIEKDKKEILNAYKKLKKNGFLIISVPAFQYLFTDYDKKIGHYRRYDKKMFKEILFDLNIKNYNTSYFDSIGYFLILFSKFLNFSDKVNLESSIKFWNIMIPLSKILDIFLKLFIGKSLMVIIKKD